MGEDLTTSLSIGIPFEDCLTLEELHDLQANSNVVNYQKREVIFRQHTRTSHIMFVKNGMVKIFKESRSKRSFILKIATSGDFIGLLSVFGNDMHQYSAASVCDTDICFVDIGAFNRTMQKNPDFSLKLIKLISSEGLFIFERLMGQTHKQLPGRIADVILYLSEVIYKNEEFDLPLTRRELAELAGTTKESFIRTLAEFKHDKIINLDGPRVSINSMKIVRTLSELG
jgi:CRP-like cAMP-binding protein